MAGLERRNAAAAVDAEVNPHSQQSPAQRIAVAVVRRGEDYLVGRRPPGVPLAGFWEFPGGKVRPDESPASAAVRECLEETGLSVIVQDTLAVVQQQYDHGLLELFFFDCAPADGTALSTESNVDSGTGFRWAPAAAVIDYEFPAANAAVLARIAERHGLTPRVP